LDVVKRKAIDNENFDVALEAKKDMDHLRHEMLSKLESEGFSISVLEGSTSSLVVEGKHNVSVVTVGDQKAEQKKDEHIENAPVQVNNNELKENGKEIAKESETSQTENSKAVAKDRKTKEAGEASPLQVADTTISAEQKKDKQNESLQLKKKEVPTPLPTDSLATLDERPIKPQSAAISFEDFDETSVPPGLQPSKGQQPSLLRRLMKKNTPAVPPTNDEDGSSPSSPPKQPAEQRPPKQVGKVPKTSVKPSDTKSKVTKTPEPVKLAPPFSVHPISTFELDSDPEHMASDHPDIAAVLGGHFITTLMSKSFQQKEWALAFVVAELERATGANDTKERCAVQVDAVAKACYSVVEKTIGDTREKVALLTMQVWNLLIGVSDAFIFNTIT
jgi:hypothetical protein